ncbi:MAG TPA: hypothetical protein VIH87_12400 [Methylocella sp.]
MCIVAPILLGFGALNLTASMLTRQADRLPLTYEFLSARDRAASVAEVKQIDEDPAMTFGAKDLRGRVSYAVASAFLYLAAAAAIVFGLWVVGHRDRARIASEAILFFLFLGYLVARTPAAFDLLRPLVVERILAAANQMGPPFNVLASGDADRSLFIQIVGFFFRDVDSFGDPAVTGLVRLNSMIGLIAVGMLLAALASASVRPENPPTHEELLSRLRIMRIVLALGAAVLVAAVLCSKILIEWPTSLLSNSQQKAIAPIGDALNLMFGASCTMALIAALGPALAAFVLDRHAFRAARADNQQAGAAAQDQAPVNAAPAQRSADDLGFAPLPSISAAIAVLSPLLASHVLELVASIVKISHA